MDQPSPFMPALGGPNAPTPHDERLLELMKQLAARQEHLLRRVAALEARAPQPVYVESEPVELDELEEAIEAITRRLDELDDGFETARSAIDEAKDDLSARLDELQSELEDLRYSLDD